MQARLYLYGPLPLNNANPPQKDFSSLEILLERQVNFNGETLGCDRGGGGGGLSVAPALRPARGGGCCRTGTEARVLEARGHFPRSLQEKWGPIHIPTLLWGSGSCFGSAVSRIQPRPLRETSPEHQYGEGAHSHHPTPGTFPSSEHPLGRTATSRGVSVARGGLTRAGGSGGSSRGCAKQVHPPRGSKGLTTWESTQV